MGWLSESLSPSCGPLTYTADDCSRALRRTRAPTPITAARAWHRAACDGLAYTTYADPAYVPADRHWADDVLVDNGGEEDSGDVISVVRNRGGTDPIERPIPGSPVSELDGRLGWSGPWDAGLRRAVGVRRSQTGVRRLGGRRWRPLVRRRAGEDGAEGGEPGAHA